MSILFIFILLVIDSVYGERRKTIHRCGRDGEICECNGEVRYGSGTFADRALRRNINGSIMCKAGQFPTRRRMLFPGRKDCLCKSRRRRVALCFWGVNRSLNQTIASLRKYIIEPLQKAQVDFDIFFHTYTLNTVNSIWAREKSVPVQGPIHEYKQLSTLLGSGNTIARWEATEQSLFDHTIDFEFYTKTQNTYPLGVMKNMIRSIHSLKRVTDLWLLEEEVHDGFSLSSSFNATSSSNSRGYYDGIIYLRPDLLFLSPINISLLFAIGTNELYTPIWSTYHGLNDRFAAGTPNAALSFGHRFNHLHTFANLGLEVHSERYLAWAVEQNGQINPIYSNEPCAIRMRTSGPSPYDCLRIESRFRHHPALRVSPSIHQVHRKPINHVAGEPSRTLA